jgi:hypothetical protein
MIDDGLWVPRAQREPRVQQPRRRRPCRGELIQIDGCDHEWFEDRSGRCTLLVFVDDATGALMELLFCESESAFSYSAAMRSYLARHGKPVALYSDKASIFRVARQEPSGGAGPSTTASPASAVPPATPSLSGSSSPSRPSSSGPATGTTSPNCAKPSATGCESTTTSAPTTRSTTRPQPRHEPGTCSSGRKRPREHQPISGGRERQLTGEQVHLL